ncbi:hypothetical protein DCCM_4254 [Desulfocucumis palustris]|uniref:Uncharacterized protein n=1 Tax=Desulfocucumis palustris TaxID=1898651 RepID=A0A2L2XMF4_9FIRM|nr:hypothetical protein DCCM_4254 [Desulfocucumis palustris]
MTEIISIFSIKKRKVLYIKKIPSAQYLLFQHIQKKTTGTKKVY